MSNLNLYNSIANLKHGECFEFPESDYGKAELWLINDRFFLFEIPQYGGNPFFVGHYKNNENGINLILRKVEDMT